MRNQLIVVVGVVRARCLTAHRQRFATPPSLSQAQPERLYGGHNQEIPQQVVPFSSRSTVAFQAGP